MASGMGGSLGELELPEKGGVSEEMAAQRREGSVA